MSTHPLLPLRRRPLLALPGLLLARPLAAQADAPVRLPRHVRMPDPQLLYVQRLVERALRLADACDRHGVPLAAAAIQFPLAHPVVAGVITGPFSPEQVAQNLGWLDTSIPDAVWDALKSEGLLEADVPVPGGA